MEFEKIKLTEQEHKNIISKLINVINKITLERKYYNDRICAIETGSKKLPDINNYKLYFEKTLLSNNEIRILLIFSSELIEFFDCPYIISVETYIEHFINTFSIQKEQKVTVEYYFHDIFKHLLAKKNYTCLIKIISRISKVDWFSRKDIAEYIKQNFTYLTIDEQKELVDILVIEY